MNYEFDYDIILGKKRLLMVILAYGGGCAFEIEPNEALPLLHGGDQAVLEAYGDIIETYYKESKKTK